MINKYSKIRLGLFLLLIIQCCIIGWNSYNLPIQWINPLPVTLFLIGSILFAFNKLWADIITFFAYIYLLINTIIMIVLEFKQCRQDILDSCFDYILKQFSLDFALLFPILILLTLLYLSFEFYKRKYKIYK